MVHGHQGDGSSPSLATERRRLRKRLRKLDRVCAKSLRRMIVAAWTGDRMLADKHERTYRRSDMRRMLTRRRLKDIGKSKVQWKEASGDE